MKLVINTCYGGFGLSDEAMMLYAKKKGFEVTLVKEGFATTFFKCKPEDLPEILKRGYLSLSNEQRRGPYSKAFSEIEILSYYSFERNDIDLIKVVEELGAAANGRYADLKIIDIPDGIKWQIEEYDGVEWVAEEHRTWS